MSENTLISMALQSFIRIKFVKSVMVFLLGCKISLSNFAL